MQLSSVRLVINVFAFFVNELSGKMSKIEVNKIVNQRPSLIKCCCMLLSAITILSNACDSSKKMTTKNKSIWVNDTLVIDGNNNDWQLPYPFTENNQTKIQYAIANNRQTLYLTIKTSDEITKKKIIKNGLTIYIDNNGNKDQSTFITFLLLPIHPGKLPQRFLSLENNAGGNFNISKDGQPTFDPTHMPVGQHDLNMIAEGKAYARQNDMADTGQLQIASFTVGGPQKYRGTYLSSDNSAGVAVAVAYNDYNEMVWEISVEFQTFYKKQIDQNDANRTISVGFLLKGVDSENLFEINALKTRPPNTLPQGEFENGANTSTGNIPGGSMSGNPMGGVGMTGGQMGAGTPPGGMPAEVDKMQHKDGQNTISEERQRALKDCLIWKHIKLNFQ